jgi:DNA polymerase III subunit epsilon
MNFVAIDFETATQSRDSACAVGLVTVENGVVTESYYSLIRPPENRYFWRNVEVHGIQAHETQHEKSFAELYPELESRLQGRTVVAHNASFDRSVLEKCMASAGLDHRSLDISDRWQCTLQIYKKKGYKPCKLSDCCSALDIPLDHHHALSDAIGCAQLYLRR